MSLEKAEQYLEHKGMLDRVIRFKRVYCNCGRGSRR